MGIDDDHDLPAFSDHLVTRLCSNIVLGHSFSYIYLLPCCFMAFYKTLA